jgi:heavy metal translocating P-type ATPase
MNLQTSLAGISLLGILVHFGLYSRPELAQYPLIFVLVVGGLPLIYELLAKALKGQFGSDLLAGISIITSVFLHEYLAGSVIVLMLSGGEALEAYAVGRASSVLEALAKRIPTRAHRKPLQSEGVWGHAEDIALNDIQIGDRIVIFPHEIAPVDGVVVEGNGHMDESFLTGEPYDAAKVIGSNVLSGAVNGEKALEIEAVRLPIDSRYAKIMAVMKDSEQRRPQMRRLGDQLGAIYTPIGVIIAALAWYFSGDPKRFLAVLVIATPCPLLIGIPVAIIGAISLAARRGIIVKDPTALEQAGRCTTMILDKTGTLTYGRPQLSETHLKEGFAQDEVLSLAAGLERYSRHPLALAIVEAAKNLPQLTATQISESAGQGLQGEVNGKQVSLCGRKHLEKADPLVDSLDSSGGLEAILLVNDEVAAVFRFHDLPRSDTRSFLAHLQSNHGYTKLMIVSGDRLQEVQRLADQVGMGSDSSKSPLGVAIELHAEKSPEEKVAIVRHETTLSRTLYVGDGINDAPALATATVGLAMGQNSDITTEAAGAVIMESSLRKVDEFLHIGRRMRSIAMQSAVGGMALSVLGMLAAAMGWISPVQGAIGQEIIDLLAVLNALRVLLQPGSLTDYEG